MATKEAYKIAWEGVKTPVEPADGKCFTLDELQSFVGGYIEMVDIADNKTIILNEEGKVRGMIPNGMATKMAEGFIDPDDVIVGNVLVTDRAYLR